MREIKPIRKGHSASTTMYQAEMELLDMHSDIPGIDEEDLGQLGTLPWSDNIKRDANVSGNDRLWRAGRDFLSIVSVPISRTLATSLLFNLSEYSPHRNSTGSMQE